MSLYYAIHPTSGHRVIVALVTRETPPEVKAMTLLEGWIARDERLVPVQSPAVRQLETLFVYYKDLPPLGALRMRHLAEYRTHVQALIDQGAFTAVEIWGRHTPPA